MIKNPKTDGNEDLLDNDEMDRPDDEVAIRYLEIDSHNIQIKATDPYGLWHVIWHKGPPPKELDGQYTSALDAENAVKAYLAAKNHKTNASNTSKSLL